MEQRDMDDGTETWINRASEIWMIGKRDMHDETERHGSKEQMRRITETWMMDQTDMNNVTERH